MRSWRELAAVAGCAVLLVLLLTASADGEKAQMAHCQASLKEVYRMAEAYSADNDGNIVPMLERKHHRGTFWSQRFVPYAKDFIHFSCPANEKRGSQAFKRDELLPGRYATAYVSYGINALISLYRNETESKIADLADPSYTVYFGDALYLRLRPTTEKLWKQDYAPVHRNGMQAVMADGHVEYFNQRNLGTYSKIPGWKRDTARWRKLKKNR